MGGEIRSGRDTSGLLLLSAVSVEALELEILDAAIAVDLEEVDCCSGLQL